MLDPILLVGAVGSLCSGAVAAAQVLGVVTAGAVAYAGQKRWRRAEALEAFFNERLEKLEDITKKGGSGLETGWDGKMVHLSGAECTEVLGYWLILNSTEDEAEKDRLNGKICEVFEAAAARDKKSA